MLYANASLLKQHLFENSEDAKNPIFVLAHAPYCAKHMADSDSGEIYKECLKSMFENHPYAIPFYYIGILKMLSANLSAKACKEYLRSMCTDLDMLIPWYKENAINVDPEFLDNLKDTMVTYIKTFINSVRSQQLATGANESVLANYSPLIPYTAKLSRSDELNTTMDSASNMLSNAIDGYSDMYCYDAHRFKILSNIALNHANSIIDNIDILFNDWRCPMDIFASFRTRRRTNDTTTIDCDIKMNTLVYFMYLWLLNQDTIPLPKEISTQYRDYLTFQEHKFVPMKKDQFGALFESMCTYNTGDINDMLTTEAWTALSEDSQEYANKFLEHSTTHIEDEIYNLNALLSEFYTMRHVETNEYTNEYFLSEFSGIIINNYNYIENIMVCEINNKYLAIPYMDIAADYQMRLITIDKDNEIKIWDDIDLHSFSDKK